MPVIRTRRIVFAAFAAVLGAAGSVPVDASAAAVTCGQVLDRSFMLQEDLTNCPADGLVIGADGIVVDLGGRTIDGMGQGAGIVNEGHDGVTVRNGTVQEFDTGVRLLAGSDEGKVEQLVLRSLRTGWRATR
jgi:hypothetical protein